mmetsp:Transcript_24707/g.70507  ORF Transcript_24707/g.70507 Transcript_24707/m.70507 type:complete len:364 (-) Transcript_24707:26-1117(-)
MGQQGSDELRPLRQRVGQKKQDDEPRQHHEQLDVAIVNHGAQLRCKLLRLADLGENVADRVQHLGLSDISRGYLPRLLVVRKLRHQPRVIAEVRVDVLQAIAHLAHVAADRDVRPQDIAGERAGRLLPSGDLHVAALLAQHRPRGLEDVRAEVVAALALLVGDGVQMRYAVDEVTFRLGHAGPLSGAVIFARYAPLPTGSADDELPGFLLDGDERANILLLESGPADVEDVQRLAELVPGVAARLHARPSVQDLLEIRPGALQRLRVHHGVGVELELLTVHPNVEVLVYARLEDIDSVVAVSVGEERAVVRREGRPVGATSGPQTEGSCCRVDAGEVRGGRLEAILAFDVRDPGVLDEPPPGR